MFHALTTMLLPVLKLWIVSTVLACAPRTWAISPSEFIRFDIADFPRDQSNISGTQAITEDSHGFIWAGDENCCKRTTGNHSRNAVFTPP